MDWTKGSEGRDVLKRRNTGLRGGLLAVVSGLFAVATPAVASESIRVSPAKVAQEHVVRGSRALQAGKLREGCFEYSSAVRVLPNWWLPYEEYVRCSRLLGTEPSKLIRELQHILSVDTQRHSLHTLLAALYEDTGDVDKAIQTYQKALAIAPWYVPATLALGRSLASSNRHQEAYAALSTALDLRPGNMQLEMGLVETCKALGRTAEAIQLLEGLANRSSRPSAIYAQLAILYEEAGDAQGRARALMKLRRYR